MHKRPRRTLAATPSESICYDGLLPVWPAAAHFLGLGRSKMYELVRNGEIAYVRVGSDRKIPRAALVAYAEHHLVTRDQSVSSRSCK
jgi:excisionase family DNA binding protein